MIFDGKSEDFATEMFVIINSTPTRINKSHLVDLYEKVSWAAPDKKFAARVVDHLYREGDCPLRYKINRLGGRSKQEKWILQAELFNELHRWASSDWKQARQEARTCQREAERYYEIVRDFLRAAEKAWGDAWGHAQLHGHAPGHAQGDAARVRRPRARRTPSPRTSASKRWARRLAPWTDLARSFQRRGLLRAVPGEGPGRARRAHPPRARHARANIERRGKDRDADD